MQHKLLISFSSHFFLAWPDYFAKVFFLRNSFFLCSMPKRSHLWFNVQCVSHYPYSKMVQINSNEAIILLAKIGIILLFLVSFCCDHISISFVMRFKWKKEQTDMTSFGLWFVERLSLEKLLDSIETFVCKSVIFFYCYFCRRRTIVASMFSEWYTELVLKLKKFLCLPQYMHDKTSVMWFFDVIDLKAQ